MVPEFSQQRRKRKLTVFSELPQNSSFLPIFPSQILGLIIVRRLLDLIFSQHDLAWIDNILPEKEKQETDKKKKRRKGVLENTDEEVGTVSGLGRRQRLSASARARGGSLGGLQQYLVQEGCYLCWSWVLRTHLFLGISLGWSKLVSVPA